MAIFYLIRHGEPDYVLAENAGFFGFGSDFAPLSEKGIQQAEKTAQDERLKDAQIIISSPFTRALQTAAIISRVTGIKIVVETELHEWIPDWTGQYKDGKLAEQWAEEFRQNHGEHPCGKKRSWETVSQIQNRVIPVVEKYAGYDKVILVAHGMAMRAITPYEDISFAELIECEYREGQHPCEYFPDEGN